MNCIVQTIAANHHVYLAQQVEKFINKLPEGEVHLTFNNLKGNHIAYITWIEHELS